MNSRLAALSAVAVLLGGTFLWQQFGSWQQEAGDQSPPAVAVPPRTGAVMLNPLQGLDPQAFGAVVERPLFNPGRRPRPAPEPMPEPVAEQPPAEPPPPQGPGPEDYALVGVASGPDGRIAALRIAASGDVVYLRKGESIDSWSVIDVGDRSVAIGTAANPVTFRMFEAKVAPAAAGEAVPPDPAQSEPLPKPLPDAQ